MALTGLLDVVLGFVLAAIACLVLLRALQRLQVRQTAYEDAPETHQVKTGTPTMGGICFAVALLPMVFRWNVPLVPEMFLIVVACAGIGFIDDYLGVRFGRNRGLSARTKFLATALVAIIFLQMSYATPTIFPRDVLFHAGTYALIAPHWLWLILGILAVTGTIHAVNLTDGLDGLATGTMIPPLIVIAGIASATFVHAATAAALLGIGACFAFLIFNKHPAKMFMGDTGSLALGALLAGTAILTGEMLLLILIGAVFVAEALSVILQVTYYKMTNGKRIFRMSPLHHHFELGGMAETGVTWRFWLASILCSALGFAVTR